MRAFSRYPIVWAALGGGNGLSRTPLTDSLVVQRQAGKASAAKLMPAGARTEEPRGVGNEAAAPGTDITCFVGGTMIMTVRGEVPVERLHVGEMMLTMHDIPFRSPLLSVGCSRVDLGRQPDASALAPVLIRAGALMPGAPVRDLRVSPAEGILLDGRLVPARLLVNGTTILQENASDHVAYYYLWMAEHSLLIADGALTESSFEDDWRQDHADAANVTAIRQPPPRGGAEQQERCIPLLSEGPELRLIQQRLALRARGPHPVH